MFAALAACVANEAGASFPSADLVRFDGATLAPGAYDPRDGAVVVEGATADGHDWALAVGEGAVIAGVPAAGEVRRYVLDGNDAAGGEVLASGNLTERFGGAVAAEGTTVFVAAPEANAGPELAAAGALLRVGGSARFDGTISQGRLGSALAGCADLDGDGVHEVAASAPFEVDPTELVDSAGDPVALASVPPRGRVYVIPVDAAAGDAAARAPINGVEANEGFGDALSCTHDLTGDSNADLVVGVPFARGAGDGLGEGVVRVYTAAGVAAGTPEVTVRAHAVGSSSAGAAESFGAAVATCTLRSAVSAGRADLVVGAPEAEGGDGAVYIFPGRDALVDGATPTLTVRGEAPGGRFGAEVACADLDGDGLDEVVVGAPGQDAPDGTLEVGGVYAFTGLGATSGTVGASVAGWSFSADRAFLRAGRSFVAGDLDGDGFAELVLLVRQRSRSQ